MEWICGDTVNQLRRKFGERANWEEHAKKRANLVEIEPKS
jgi:hypothetical protein